MIDYMSSDLIPATFAGGVEPGTQVALVKEKIPAPSDTNSATQLTVKKMGEYARKAIPSEQCRQAAYEAFKLYAMGQNNPQTICWGIFWVAKHKVKFSRDEPRLFQVGEPEALDLLVAPDVLLAADKPTEDCDGFTMLVCCLLSIFGIKSYIVTIAADPEDKDRWSHVFAMAELKDGTRIPLDASHGKYPGWMVPREHVYRWQAWDLDGNAVDVLPPEQNTLHGYSRRGMGQDWPSELPGSVPVDIPVGTFNAPFPLAPGESLPLSIPSAPTTPTNWGNIISSLVSGGVKAFQTSQLPSGYFVDPNTGRLVNAPAGQYVGGPYNPLLGTSSSLGSLLPWLGVGLVAVLIFSSMGKK